MKAFSQSGLNSLLQTILGSITNNLMQWKENSRRDAEKLCKFLYVFCCKLTLFMEDI